MGKLGLLEKLFIFCHSNILVCWLLIGVELGFIYWARFYSGFWLITIGCLPLLLCMFRSLQSLNHSYRLKSWKIPRIMECFACLLIVIIDTGVDFGWFFEFWLGCDAHLMSFLHRMRNSLSNHHMNDIGKIQTLKTTWSLLFFFFL